MASNSKIKKVKTIGIGSISLISVLGVILVVYPFFNEQETLKIQVQEKISENNVLSSRITNLKKTADQVPAIKQINDSLTTRFPATADIPGLISSISSTAARSGLGAGSITGLTTELPTIVADTAAALPAAGAAAPAASGPVDNTDTGSGGAAAPAAPAAGGTPSAGGGDLASMAVSITVEGGTAELSQFVKNLSSGQGRAFLIKSFTMEAAEDGNSKLTLETETFLYRTLPDPAAPPAAGTPAAGTPAAGTPATGTTPPATNQ